MNCVSDFYEKKYKEAVIVSSDGDYSELVEFLKKKSSFHALVSPSNKCSYLLRKQNVRLFYLDSLKKKVERLAKKEKAPSKDGTLKGSLS